MKFCPDSQENLRGFTNATFSGEELYNFTARYLTEKEQEKEITWSYLQPSLQVLAGGDSMLGKYNPDYEPRLTFIVSDSVL
jgi:hypothetical protein